MEMFPVYQPIHENDINLQLDEYYPAESSTSNMDPSLPIQLENPTCEGIKSEVGHKMDPESLDFTMLLDELFPDEDKEPAKSPPKTPCSEVVTELPPPKLQKTYLFLSKKRGLLPESTLSPTRNVTSPLDIAKSIMKGETKVVESSSRIAIQPHIRTSSSNESLKPKYSRREHYKTLRGTVGSNSPSKESRQLSRIRTSTNTRKSNK